MKKDLMQVFSDPRFCSVRVILVGNEEETYFVGKDITESLGYDDGNKAIVTHVDPEDRIFLDAETQRQNGVEFDYKELGQRGGWLINESGMYSLILSSKLKSAKDFKRWVTKSVLPSIRKTGQYNIDDDISAELKAILMHDKKIKAVESRIDSLEDNIHITRSQQKQLKQFVSEIVVSALGSKHSTAYKKFSGKAFSTFWRDYYNRFNVTSYLDTPKLSFQEALQFINDWKPNDELKYLIIGANTYIQQELVGGQA